MVLKRKKKGKKPSGFSMKIRILASTKTPYRGKLCTGVRGDEKVKTESEREKVKMGMGRVWVSVQGLEGLSTYSASNNINVSCEQSPNPSFALWKQC